MWRTHKHQTLQNFLQASQKKPDPTRRKGTNACWSGVPARPRLEKFNRTKEKVKEIHDRMWSRWGTQCGSYPTVKRTMLVLLKSSLYVARFSTPEAQNCNKPLDASHPGHRGYTKKSNTCCTSINSRCLWTRIFLRGTILLPFCPGIWLIYDESLCA